jgi:SAM-dependent methyltransferase
VQWADLVPAGATVLDLATGSGRNALFFAARGHKVTAVDIDLGRLPPADNVERVQANLENGNPWPLPGRRFGAATVTNYLHRPLMPELLETVRGRFSVIAYEARLTSEPTMAMVQRIAARRL